MIEPTETLDEFQGRRFLDGSATMCALSIVLPTHQGKSPEKDSGLQLFLSDQEIEKA
jgi:hypothetical protein